MKKILMMDLPAAVEHALTEHLSGCAGLALLSPKKTSAAAALLPDLVVTGGSARPAAACPVLALSWEAPHRLGPLLRRIIQMLRQPALYTADIPLGRRLFRPQEKILLDRRGESAALTDREVEILAYLLRRRGETVGRDEMLKAIWSYQEGIDTHTLETHIYRLRQKIEDAAENPQLLLTVEGGYCLRLPPEEEK